MSKTEILNYASILPEKKRSKTERKFPVEVVKSPENSTKNRKRVGRGRSSGQGKTCGRGQKGQGSRTGVSRKPGFEGGQMPLHRRMPKRGFTNIFKKDFEVINLWNLAGLSGAIGPDQLFEKGLVSDKDSSIKILGTGELKGALNITADAFSESAKAKIEKAGGSVTVRPPKTQKYIRPKKEKTKK